MNGRTARAIRRLAARLALAAAQKATDASGRSPPRAEVAFAFGHNKRALLRWWYSMTPRERGRRRKKLLA